MNKLTSAKRFQVVSASGEGCSIRSAVRMTGVAKNTVTKLLVELGAMCVESKIGSCGIYHAVPLGKQGEFGYGDVWTGVAMDAEIKLMPTWMIGKRDAGTARAFIEYLELRLADCVQITSDGLKVYLDAIDQLFRSNVDYAVLVKLFGDDKPQAEARDGRPQCTGTRQTAKINNPGKAQLHRAAEPHDANESAPIHAADERVL